MMDHALWCKAGNKPKTSSSLNDEGFLPPKENKTRRNTVTYMTQAHDVINFFCKKKYIHQPI